MPSFWSDPINFIVTWLTGVLVGLGLPLGIISFLLTLVGAVIMPLGAMLFCLFLIWYERKLIGRVQDRPGPNRVGPYGIIQPVADMLKIFTKEYITPVGADKIPYNLAPVLAVAAVLLIWAVVPFANRIYGVDLNVAALYIIAVGALGTLAIIMAGWSSNNKFALLGAFRAAALLVSYEVPMVLALLVPVFLSRSMSLNTIVQAQDIWYLFVAPIPAFIFFLTSIAEIGRSPFDLLEAESEIVSGFNVEYSGLKFGMFYVAEFLHAFTISLLFTTLFLGGWRGPGAEQIPFLGVIYYILKTFIVSFIGVLIRASMPRFRTDQILNLAWKLLTPLSLVMIVVTAVGKSLVASLDTFWQAAILLVANLVVGWIAQRLYQDAEGRQRQARLQALPVARPRPVAVPPRIPEPEAENANSGAQP